MVMANVRTFNIRYNNLNIITAQVPADKIKDADSMGIVRAAMGHAYMEQLKGNWTDDAEQDRVVVLDKDNPGVYVGRRLRPKSKKDEPFYVMEI